MKLDKIIQQAKQKCLDSGGRFTEKRSAVLQTLLLAEQPLSAYELVDLYNKDNNEPIQPMSAYRILDFFVERDLVHKLSSSNKYVACSHLACDHSHHDQYFLVCKKCGISKEVAMNSELMTQLQQSVAASGFHLLDSQFELDCICDQCKNKKPTDQ